MEMTHSQKQRSATPTSTGISPEEIAEDIMQQVGSGQLPLGAWVRQNDIAMQFGISRTPVREAMRLLSARGVVELIPNRGARIRVPSDKEIVDSYQVRAELEGLAASLAARFATERQLEQLKEAEELFEFAVTGADSTGNNLEDRRRMWSQANDQFHEIIMAASRNKSIEAATIFIHNSVPRNLTWGELSKEPRLMKANIQQHKAIRRAIEDGDAEAAREAMIEHVIRAGELVVAGLHATD